MYIVSQITSGGTKEGVVFVNNQDTFKCNRFSLEKKKKANTVLLQH